MSSRESLKQFCLRALGAPVVEINVAEEQLQDRIDEALSFWNLYHYDGIEKVYIGHPITCSSLMITTNNATSFYHDTVITGATSGATALCQVSTDNTLLMIRNVTGAFLAGENISNPQYTATISSNPAFYTPGDTENHWVRVPDDIYGITRVLPLEQPNSSTQYLFDVQYQLMLNDVTNLVSTDVQYFTMSMQYLDLIDFQLNTKPDFEFNRMKGQLRLDVSWQGKIRTGQVLVMEGYKAIDGESFTKVWNEPWLRLYTTALFKRQWGVNLKKFSGLTLPGGVKVDGDVLFQEAILDIKALETDLLTKSAPLSFFMG